MLTRCRGIFTRRLVLKVFDEASLDSRPHFLSPHGAKKQQTTDKNLILNKLHVQVYLVKLSVLLHALKLIGRTNIHHHMDASHSLAYIGSPQHLGPRTSSRQHLKHTKTQQ